jgi:hypothetical protein
VELNKPENCPPAKNIFTRTSRQTGLANRFDPSGLSLIKNQVAPPIYDRIYLPYILSSGYIPVNQWPAVAVRAYILLTIPFVLPLPTIKKRSVHFRQEWLSKVPAAPEEAELITCPACLGQHRLIYEDEKPTPTSWRYVECDYKYVLAVVEGRILADTPLEIDEE